MTGSILSRRYFGALLLASPLAFLLPGAPYAVEEPIDIPPPEFDPPEPDAKGVALFAGGCFWGVQGVFQHVKGVCRAVSGYTGGAAENARYDRVTTGQTGHAEAVEVMYDPAVVTYGQLLQIFFSVAHNPTQLNFQGPDYGTQYRSALFPRNEQQAETARAYIEQLDATGRFSGPIVTAIEAFSGFYPAEQYHQDFLTLNPAWPYIVINDLPKIAALKALFASHYRDEPVLVGQL